MISCWTRIWKHEEGQRIKSGQCNRDWTGSLSCAKSTLPTAKYYSRSITEESVSSFLSPFAHLILSVLITWFLLIGHGMQTQIIREQAFATVISFHFEDLSKLLIYFHLFYALCVCCYALSDNSERSSMPWSKPLAMECNVATKRNREPCWALDWTKAQIPSGSPSKQTAVLQQATGWW